MKAVIRLMQIILTAVWLCLLAVCLLLFESTHSNGLPGLGEWRCFIVTDSGMSPELAPGDLAVIHMGEAPEAGDAVLVKDSAGLLELTRIIGSSEGQLILKPDGRDESRLAPAEETEGVYAGYIPGLGEPFRFLCSLPGVIIIAAAGLILIVLPGFLLHTPKAAKPRPERGTERPSPETDRSRRSGYTPRH